MALRNVVTWDLSTLVAQRLALWTLIEEVSSRFPVEQIWYINFFKVGVFWAVSESLFPCSSTVHGNTLFETKTSLSNDKKNRQ